MPQASAPSRWVPEGREDALAAAFVRLGRRLRSVHSDATIEGEEQA